jgi:hypothetical protein
MTEKEAARLAKQKYPLTEKEKRCINEYGKMVINRGRYKRELLASHLAKRQYDDKPAHDTISGDNTPQLNDSTGTKAILDKGAEQSGPDN